MKEQSIIGIIGPPGIPGECIICSKVILSNTTHLFYANEENPILICEDCLNKYIENNDDIERIEEMNNVKLNVERLNERIKIIEATIKLLEE